MPKIISAKYKNGVIQPEKPLELAENQWLKVVIMTTDIHDEAKRVIFDFDIGDEITKQDVMAWK